MDNFNKILEILFNSMPYVFWKDRSGRYLGSNLNQARNLGFKSPQEFIGKTIFEIIDDQKLAKIIDDIDNKVMNEDITIVNIEKIPTSDGMEKIYLSQKSPIPSENGEVVGMIGFSVDITDIKKQEAKAMQERDNLLILSAQKEAERLKLENTANRAQLEAQEKFTKTANQVAHDIRSPLASLLMIVKSCEEIPERERIALRSASTRISDIANNLLNQYKFDKNDAPSQTDEKKEYFNFCDTPAADYCCFDLKFALLSKPETLTFSSVVSD